jgi:hypothetical protein
MITRTTLRVALLMAALCLLGSACSASAPEPLPRREVAPDAVIDPARPCIREAPVAVPSAQAEPAGQATAGGLGATFDPGTNKIVLSAGQGITLPALSQAIDDPRAVREVAPGEWLLGATIDILPGASLRVRAPEVRWLMLSSSPAGFASIKALGGGLDIAGACVTSWDLTQGRVDTEHLDGRSFLLARNGGQLTIDHAEVRYLGYGEVEAYGMSWRVQGTSGHITNSIVSHLFYGLYTFDISGLVVQDNEFHDNVTASFWLKMHRQRHSRLHRLSERAPRNRALPERRPKSRREQRVLRIRHRRGPDRTQQPRRTQPDPWRPAGRRPARQRGQPHHAARQHHRRERPLRRLRRQHRPLRADRQHLFDNRTGIMLENAAPPPPTENRVFGNDKGDIGSATR